MENEIHKNNIKLLEVLFQGIFCKLEENEFNWDYVTKVTILNSEFCILELGYEQYELYKYELV